MPRLSRVLLVAIGAILLGGGPPAVAHDAPMPPGRRHGLLPNEQWVMQHWAPFDERELGAALGLSVSQVEAYLYNDHHTLAQLAAARGVDFETLVHGLAGWTETLPAADRPAIEQRIRLTLASGHLAQHLLFHVFHGEGLTPALKRAAKLPKARFATLRNDRWSYRRLILHAGGDPAKAMATIASQVRVRQQAGLSSAQTPRSQGDRLVACRAGSAARRSRSTRPRRTTARTPSTHPTTQRRTSRSPARSRRSRTG